MIERCQAATKNPGIAVECIEALLRGELADHEVDAKAGLVYLVGCIEHVKKRLDRIAAGYPEIK